MHLGHRHRFRRRSHWHRQHPCNLPQLCPCSTNHRSDLVILRGDGLRHRRLHCPSRSWTSSIRSPLLSQYLPRTRERIALSIHQSLDLNRDLDVAFAIEPLPGPALVRLQLRKLRFPESQYVWLNFQKTRNIPDLEIETIGDSRNLDGALRGRMRCHNKTQQTALLSRSIGHSLHLK